MLPQRRPALGLTAVRSRSGLARRIERILRVRGRVPQAGRLWTVLAATLTMTAALLIALAQQRPAAAEEPPQPFQPEGWKFTVHSRAAAVPAASRELEAIALAGQVLGADGKPVAEADVTLLSGPQPAGQARTDGEGRFRLEGKYNPAEAAVALARGPGHGPGGQWLPADPRHYGAGPRTDAEGKIILPCLVPGANYRISQLDGKARDFTVEPGQTVDLGDVRVAKPEQTKKLPVIKPEK